MIRRLLLRCFFVWLRCRGYCYRLRFPEHIMDLGRKAQFRPEEPAAGPPALYRESRNGDDRFRQYLRFLGRPAFRER